MESQIIKKGNEADDLLQCCSKLEAFGAAISGLGFQAANSGDQTLDGEGEQLGYIISDYARIIKAALEDAYPALNRFFMYGGGTLNTRLRKTHEEIQKLDNEPGTAMLLIDREVEEIDSYLVDYQLINEWKERFEKLRKEALDKIHRSKRKGASARIGDHTETPATDLSRSATQ